MTLSTAAVYPVRVQTRFWSIPAFLPALGIATATALVILWQHSHVAVFWDLAYLLDTAARIAGGAMPYRDFPLAHAPVPFLIQAAILHLFGPGIRYAQLYTALAGAVGTLLTWAILRQKQKSGNSHIQAFLLTLPLIALGLYCVFPFPSYDCDCALAVLLALWLWQCMEIHPTRTRGFLAGAALVLPLFCKQNIGLPFLAAALFLLSAMLLLQKTNNRLAPLIPTQALWSTLLGAASALAAALLTLQFTCGLSNYLHWTLRFAMQRRMVGASTMLTIFHEPTLLWMLPCVAAGILLLRFCPHQRWRQIAAFLLLAAPLFCPVAALFLYSDAEARSDALLAIWPLLLLLSIVLALFRLRSGLSPRSALPLLMLAAIYGTLLSQQIWGSTYALWPFFLLLTAELLTALKTLPEAGRLPHALAATTALVLLVCGGFYVDSEERLSYVDLPAGPTLRATRPALLGLATSGPYIAEFEELLHYAEAKIPQQDGILLLPGEDPFYYATGRTPHFSVLLFDPATDPLTPLETALEARRSSIRWLILKTHQQISDDPMPNKAETLAALLPDYQLADRLQGYEVYRRVEDPSPAH